MKLGADHIDAHARQPCPACGHELDSMMGAGHDEAPVPGDNTVCIGCGKLLRFNGPTEQLTSISIKELDPEARQVVHEIQRAILARRGS